MTQFKVGKALSTAINVWYGTVRVFAMSPILKEKMGMVQRNLKFMDSRRDIFSLDFTSQNLAVRKVIDPNLNISLQGAFTQ